MEISDTMRMVFNTMKEGITIIDTKGCIVFANIAYKEFLERETSKDVNVLEGRYLRELRPGARLPEVINTGEPILHVTRHEGDESYFVNMYPIYDKNRQLIGGISVITFLEDAYQVREKLEAMELRNRQLLRRISKANGARYTFEDIIAVSPNSVEIKSMAEHVASTDAPVLLQGESGTGKELYAQAIHNGSMRRNGVFLAINCATFNKSTLESELFGYSEGAFTGAKKGGKIGLFEAANGGTLFLDEISEMDINMQAKLLRVLEEWRIRPIGAVKEIDVDVRIIAACNVNLKELANKGQFRVDLYYRLNTITIEIPPLRKRKDDISYLANHILKGLSSKLHRSFRLEKAVLNTFRCHNWPGNVRELRNVLEFSAYLSSDGIIGDDLLPRNLAEKNMAADNMPMAQQVKKFEIDIIRKKLLVNGDDLMGKKKTAAELGISLATLYSKIK